MRRHLTKHEVLSLIAAAGTVGRYPERDRLMVLLAYRHGLRSSEVCGLRWEDVDLVSSELYVRRLKGGNASTHVLASDEIEALSTLWAPRTYVFVNERGRRMARGSFQRIVLRAGELAGLPFRVWPHMLRHSAGVHLAGAGTNAFVIRDFLGHRDLAMTSHYCRLAGGRYKEASQILSG